MSGATGIYAQTGSECNKPKIGGTTTLLGDPKIKAEKPYTIICFPGGDIELSRCEDGRYWVHIAVRGDDVGSMPPARIVDARMDHEGRYNDGGNLALREAVEASDVRHIAFLIEPPAATGASS